MRLFEQCMLLRTHMKLGVSKHTAAAQDDYICKDKYNCRFLVMIVPSKFTPPSSVPLL